MAKPIQIKDTILFAASTSTHSIHILPAAQDRSEPCIDTPQHKLCMYHDHGIGELYDMQADPWEFDDLWDSPAHQEIKHQLIRDAFDAHVVLTTDMGSRRIAPM